MPVVDVTSFDALPSAVDALLRAASARSFYHHPAWYRVFASTAALPGTAARIYTDAPVAAAALVCGATPRADLASLTNYYSCEFAIATLTGAPPDRRAVDGIVHAIAADRPRWPIISLTALDPLDPAFARLRSSFQGAGFSAEPFFDFGTWYETTSGMSFSDYVKERPSALRNTWKRKLAKLSKAGRIETRILRDGDGLESAIADYEAIYRSSWKGSEPHPLFMPTLMRACAELGCLRLGVLRLDGVPAAAQMWIHWQGRSTIYKLAHDKRFDDLSVGTILTMEMTDHVLSIDRPDEIDLGRGDDPYKKLWLPKRRERWGLSIANPRTPAGLKISVKHLAKRLLGRRPVPPIAIPPN